MESEENTHTMLTFNSPKDQSSYIKVIGVGGGGGNAVNHMQREGITGVDFIICNTDMKALNSSPVANKIVLGELGAGNIPERAKRAAEAHADEIREVLTTNTKMLFITAGMGGGTGTGAAPVIAEIAKSIEVDDTEVKTILVVAVVTLPFAFEGKRRREQAEMGIAELCKHVDSILIINNDKLRTFGNMTISESFGKADDVLLTAVKGIAEIITNQSYVGIDFRDVNTVMENSGTALMGTGIGTGEERAINAINQAATSALLDDNTIAGAKNILLHITFSPEHEITMDELGIVTDRLGMLTGDCDPNVIWGEGADDTLGEELKITLIASGFEKKTPNLSDTDTTHRIPFPDEETKDKAPTKQTISDTSDIRIIHNTKSANDSSNQSSIPYCEPVLPDFKPLTPAPVQDWIPQNTQQTSSVPEHSNTPSSATPAQIVVAPQPTATISEPITIAPVQPAISTNSIANAHVTTGIKHYLDLDSNEVEKPNNVDSPKGSSDGIQLISNSNTGLTNPEPTPSPFKPTQEIAPEKTTPYIGLESITTSTLGNSTISSSQDEEARNRAERIKKINDILHNDPNGATIIASFDPESLNNISINPTSNQSIIKKKRIDRTGNILESQLEVYEVPD